MGKGPVDAILIASIFIRGYLILEIINFLSLGDENSYQQLHKKKTDCTILAILSVFEIVFAPVLHCTTSVLCYIILHCDTNALV